MHSIVHAGTVALLLTLVSQTVSHLPESGRVSISVGRLRVWNCKTTAGR